MITATHKNETNEPLTTIPITNEKNNVNHNDVEKMW